MKFFLIGLFLLNNLLLLSQNFEIIGGLNRNTYYTAGKNVAYYSSSYESDLGYVMRVGVEDIHINWLKLKFTLSLENYQGELKVTAGGMAGECTTDAEVSKSILSLGFFPVNFKILKRLDFNLGIEYSRLLREDFNGTKSCWAIVDTRPTELIFASWDSDLNDEYEEYSAKTYFGLRGRIAYDINISKKLAISPQYSYYLGITHEFDEFPELAKSMRHYFCIGLQRKLK